MKYAPIRIKANFWEKSILFFSDGAPLCGNIWGYKKEEGKNLMYLPLVLSFYSALLG